MRLRTNDQLCCPASYLGICLALTLVMPALVMPASVKAQSLVHNQIAGRVGLERAWFAQVQLESSRHQVAHWLLDRDQLFAMTSAGTIQAFDVETGATLWTTALGEGHSPATGVAVNSNYVAALGAGRLFALDRRNGQKLWSRATGGASVAAPALSESHAYVVGLSGRVEGISLRSPQSEAWQYQSDGRIYNSPTTTGNVVSWPTSTGKLYVGRAENPRVLFRVETDDEIVAAPAEQEPYLYVGSLDGYLYSFHEQTGKEHWRYATGFAITSRPAIVGEIAYVASEGPMLHAVNSETGQPLWQLNGVAQFVALGEQHTYGMDRHGTLGVIDNKTGGVAGQMATGTGNSAIVNDQSDRIFLVDQRGLIQCLHEVGAEKPTWHRQPRPSADGSGSKGSGAKGSGSKGSDTKGSGTKDEDEFGSATKDEGSGTKDEGSGTKDDSPFEADQPADEVDEPNPFEF